MKNRHLRKIVYITGMAGLVLGFNACMTTGYVATEPVYIERSRPPQPSTSHIWVNDDWGWNRSDRVYVQKSGYWHAPYQGRTYVSGRWQDSPRGKSWSQGHWKRNSR